MGCSNAARREEVQRRFEARARRDYVGQQQSWNYVRRLLESYVGLAPRATCSDWVVHFTGPSGSGKSFLAEIIADAAFEPWEEEPYPRASTAAATAGCALVGWMGMFLGPVGASVGCTAGAYGATAIIDAAQHAITPLQSAFRAPRSFPAQCGVRQHHFGRNSGLAEVEAWEYSVAAELLRDPAAVLVLDDVGRLNDAAAFDHLGRLLCGVGGNSVPEFRTGPTRPELVPASHALFVLTSDLELDASDGAIGCELGTSFEEMLDRVSAQSARFWSERALAPPDWWGRFPIVPFRELCPDELSAAVHKYVNRQCDLARRRVEADLERRRSWAIGAAQEYRWVGEARARSRRDLGDGLTSRCDHPPANAGAILGALAQRARCVHRRERRHEEARGRARAGRVGHRRLRPACRPPSAAGAHRPRRGWRDDGDGGRPPARGEPAEFVNVHVHDRRVLRHTRGWRRCGLAGRHTAGEVRAHAPHVHVTPVALRVRRGSRAGARRRRRPRRRRGRRGMQTEPATAQRLSTVR